jgi:hypothetical protein
MPTVDFEINSTLEEEILYIFAKHFDGRVNGTSEIQAKAYELSQHGNKVLSELRFVRENSFILSYEILSVLHSSVVKGFLKKSFINSEFCYELTAQGRAYS